VEVAEKKLRPAIIPASFTGFSTKLFIKKAYGLLAGWQKYGERLASLSQLLWGYCGGFAEQNKNKKAVTLVML
jgi:hypothetical protein